MGYMDIAHTRIYVDVRRIKSDVAGDTPGCRPNTNEEEEMSEAPFRLIGEPRSVLATKELARQFRDMIPVPNDRPLSQRRLTLHRDELAKGCFRPITWAIAKCLETDKTYRVNGKHTSTLLSEEGMEIPAGLYVVIEEYECETLEGAVKLYNSFDKRMQARTSNDVNMSYAGTIPSLRDLSKNVISSAVAGIAYATWGESASHVQPDERAAKLREHEEFVLWLNDILTGDVGLEERKDSRRISRQAVVAAMLGSWQIAQGAATKFWKAVRDATGPKSTSGDRRLHDYLRDHSVEKGRGTKEMASTSTREMHVKCIHGWNAWCDGTSTVLKYMADAPIPKFKRPKR